MARTTWSALAAIALPMVAAITPEQFLSAPRRSEIVPNPTGEWGVFSATNYSFEDHEATTVWNLVNLTSGEISFLVDGSEISEMAWIPSENASTSVIYLNGTNEAGDGGVSLYYADVTDLGNATVAAELDAPYSGLKIALTEGGDINFLVYALAYPNGTAVNPETVPEPINTGRIYTSVWVRHWDTWLDETRNNLFSGTLASSDDGYSLDGELTNRISGLRGLNPAEVPDRPFGDSSCYDISPDGQTIAFWTRDINVPIVNHTVAPIYLAPFDGSSEPALLNERNGPNTPPNAKGYSVVPTFSPDSQYIAYFQMDHEAYESDRNKIYIANANAENPNITVLAENWDRTPELLKWSNDQSSLWVGASDLGQYRIFNIPLTAQADFEPQNITDMGVVAAFDVLPDDNLIVADSKVWSSRDYYVISPEGEVVLDILKANEVDAELEGLGPQDYSEFYFKGDFADIHALITYPTGFDPNETYPLAYVIHGGPQGTNANSWGSRWNFKVWADAGPFVVVAPNPTASIGWGQDLIDGIVNNWGGSPYIDLVNGWEYVRDNFDYIDTDNGIAAGASYGGYMTNWIQGHDLGREFKALVTHDGSTNTLSQYASEELFFMEHDFNGSFIDVPENYRRYNPIDHVANWSTPQLVIHNTLDYRLPESEGLLLFNLLQTKGVPSKFLNFPDENHWVLNRENSIVWHDTIFQWIRYYSGISEESPFE